MTVSSAHPGSQESDNALDPERVICSLKLSYKLWTEHMLMRSSMIRLLYKISYAVEK